MGARAWAGRGWPGAHLQVCMAGCVLCLCAGWIPRRGTGVKTVPKTRSPTSRIKALLLPSYFLKSSPAQSCTALSSWVWQGQLPASLWSLSSMGCPLLLIAAPRRGDCHQCPSPGCLTHGNSVARPSALLLTCLPSCCCPMQPPSACHSCSCSLAVRLGWKPH